jgi:glycosyltransferase involved in cell wall biosynthesis
MSPRITVIIPVYNEEGIVREACRDLAAKLDAKKWDYELLLTENGSKDRTVAILEELAKELPRLRFIHSDEPNYGKALKRGILDAQGTYVFCDEIDLCDVGFYERALGILERGEAEMVVGSKRALGSADRRPAFRRFATWGHNKVLQVALGFQGTDTHGLKAFVREKIAPVASRCVVDKDVFASELVLRAGLEGKKVTEIPVELEEKRPPSIALFKRVPNVLKQVAKLIWVLRVQTPAKGEAEKTERA